MEAFKKYKKYKDFFIFMKEDKALKEFFGFKFKEDKKSYEFRTRNYKTLRSVEKAINLYLKTKKEQ